MSMKCEKHVRLVFSDALLDPCAICACEAECCSSAAPSLAADATYRVADIARRSPSSVAYDGFSAVSGGGNPRAGGYG